MYSPPIYSFLSKISSYLHPIAKTTTSLWDQLAPYNNECPLVTTYNDLACTDQRREAMRPATGCAATAMAQVLYVWRDEYAKPEVKEGKLTQDIPARNNVVYQSAEKEGEKEDAKDVPVYLKYTDEAIPATTTIDWANLIDEYTERNAEGKIVIDENGGKGTPEQKAAVANLMHICAALNEMQYGTIYSGGSGAYPYAGVKGASKYLGFTNARFEQQLMYEYGEWVQRLYNELKVAKAVCFGGTSSSGGHAFVIDGYSKEDLFHVNWGWSGVANEAPEDGGYYRLNSLLPINQGTGGAVVNDGYRLDQSFITGLYPNAPAPTEEPKMSATIVNTSQLQAKVKDGKLKMYVFAVCTNEMAPHMQAQTALCLENESGYKSFIPLNKELASLYLMDNVSADTLLTWTGVTDGDYKIQQYYRTTADGEWALCADAANKYISVQVSGNQATVRNRGRLEVELLSCELKEQAPKGEDVSLKMRYKMTAGSIPGTWLASIAIPVKEDEEGDFDADYSRKECTAMPPTVVNAKAGDEIDIDATFSADNLAVGHYRLVCVGIFGMFPSDRYFQIVESSDPSGIRSVDNVPSASDNSQWHDLQGRQIQNATKGVYICNGKKLIIK